MRPIKPASPSRLRLASWSGLVVAAVAAVGLALTVIVARAGLRDATLLLVRGEGEGLLSSVREELLQHRGPADQGTLSAILARHRGEGLTYVGVGGPRREMVAEAGAATLGDPSMQSGEVRAEGHHGRLVEMLPGFGLPDVAGAPPPPPPFGPEGTEWPPPPMGAPPPPPGQPARGALAALGRVPPMIVVEFDTPLVTGLLVAMDRTLAVGVLGALVLLGTGLALARSVARQTAMARAAERDRRLVALGGMSSVMAHELRNPLASLKGHAQLLVEALPPGTKEGEKAARVVREAERLERLTRDLLDFVRDGPLHAESVSPSAMLDRALEGLPKSRIDVDLASAPPTVRVDVARMASAVSNLVRNALQATEGDERVRVRVEARGQGVLLEVRDQGEGIPAGDEERLFEPFVTTRVRGTGLGLAVARRAVEQHGGTLHGATHPEGGAVFSLVLPGDS